MSPITVILIVIMQLSKPKFKLWASETECSTHFAVYYKQGGQRKARNALFYLNVSQMRGNSSSPVW